MAMLFVKFHAHAAREHATRRERLPNSVVQFLAAFLISTRSIEAMWPSSEAPPTTIRPLFGAGTS